MTHEPSPGQRRCQIYRHVRILPDACDVCGLSLTSCQASRDINRAPCCDNCTGHDV